MACPSCSVGQQARDIVWSSHVEQTVLYALLPFLIVFAVCVGVDRIGRPSPPKGERRSLQPQPSPHEEALP